MYYWSLLWWHNNIQHLSLITHHCHNLFLLAVLGLFCKMSLKCCMFCDVFLILRLCKKWQFQLRQKVLTWVHVTLWLNVKSAYHQEVLLKNVLRKVSLYFVFRNEDRGGLIVEAIFSKDLIQNSKWTKSFCETSKKRTTIVILTNAGKW